MFGLSKLFWIFTFVVAILFAFFPKLDLMVSSLFFDKERGFFLSNVEPFDFMHDYVREIFLAPLILLLLMLIYQMIKRREFKRFNKKAIAFILSFSIIGPGVVTNLIIKDHSSRVRPKNIENFNPKSQKSFTPYYSLKGECSHNCSFISGHVAATFVFVAIAYVLESQTAFILAVLFASLMAVSRVVQGGHFLSDVVFTFIINLIILKILYYLFFKESAMIKEKS